MANLGHPHQHGEPASDLGQPPGGDESVEGTTPPPHEPGLFGQERPKSAQAPARRQQQRRRR